ncbi:MAG: two pore domain potassium channel family protein [Chlorobi bacterium]|nr:two pore domain potassium channel family protein [Chlorobiota bacterium]
MQTKFSEFTVKIIKKPFEKEGFKYPETAVVTFLDSEKKITDEQTFGYADAAYLNKYLRENNELQLDYAYIENFNIDFLKAEIYSEKIILPNFSAKEAFFFSEKEINLSGILFEGKYINFGNTYFVCKTLNFSYSVFFAETTDFSYSVFKTNIVNFSKTTFSDGDFIMKNTIFSEGIKDFQNIEFQEGKKSFINIEFGNGDVLFTDTKFGNGLTSFKVSEFGNGRIDFSRAKFGKGETTFEKVNFGNGDVSFRTAEFANSKVNFTSAEFGNGKKSFINTDFGNGNIYFKNANFGDGAVSFRLAQFGSGTADFHFSEFGNGNITFDRAVFLNGSIDFKAVNFGTGKVSFDKTYFGDNNITLEGSTLNGELAIKNSVFGKGEFNFSEADFKNSDVEINNVDFGIGKITFKQSNFRTLSLKGSQLDNYFNLQITSCKMLDLSDTVVKDILDINPPDFDPVIEAIDLSGMRLLGRIYIDWRRANIKELIYKQNTSYKSKEEQFRILKENYNATGQYSYEDEAYVEFKRTEAKALLQDEISKKNRLKITAYIKYAFKWLVFDKMGKFATDPLRVLTTMLITYLIFTFLYLILAEFGEVHIVSSLFAPDDPRILSPAGKAFYHSAITFLTIGYGDYYPEGISRWISGIEGFVGLFLMSYFTVAFVRKILR